MENKTKTSPFVPPKKIQSSKSLLPLNKYPQAAIKCLQYDFLFQTNPSLTEQEAVRGKFLGKPPWRQNVVTQACNPNTERLRKEDPKFQA